jgi:hypothetical protein
MNKVGGGLLRVTSKYARFQATEIQYDRKLATAASVNHDAA